MANSLMTAAELSKVLSEMHPKDLKRIEQKYRREKKVKEDLTKLTDEALEMRIMYSRDARSGEPFDPLWDEWMRRYKKLKLDLDSCKPENRDD